MEEFMSVKVRERVYPETNTSTWQADIHVKLLDGRKIRERSKIPGATSRSAALKWAHERERWLILHGHEQGAQQLEPPRMPTLAEFSRRFIEEYALANRLKPSTVQNKRMIIHNYLVPVLGTRALDKITEADVQRLKAAFADQAPASVNNILTLLSTLLKVAMEWGVIASMPKIRKLKQQPQRFAYYEDESYERLLTAARSLDPRSLLVVLLGAEAGLRGGEIVALKLKHCDLRRGVIHVEENDWSGHVGTPKGNRTRQVVMTAQLRAALRDLAATQRDPDQRVILRDDGTAASKRVVDGWLYRAQRAAGLAKKGPHILRHTFCSRLALRGATPKAIKELAGHVHSSTTDRYLHLAPSALKTAIDLLDTPCCAGA
jgi:integrase